MPRIALCENNLPKYFWAKAINTSCYILNRRFIRPILMKTPYDLWMGRKPSISYFHTFGCKCFILNNGKENLTKFDLRSDEGILMGYLITSKGYRVHNKRTLVIEESIHVVFNESNNSYPKMSMNDKEEEFRTKKQVCPNSLDSLEKQRNYSFEQEEEEENEVIEH